MKQFELQRHNQKRGEDRRRNNKKQMPFVVRRVEPVALARRRDASSAADGGELDPRDAISNATLTVICSTKLKIDN